MPTQKNIFEFADKFGYESPFSDWITEEKEKREEREKERQKRAISKKMKAHEGDGIFISPLTTTPLKAKVIEKLSLIIGFELTIAENGKLVLVKDKEDKPVPKGESLLGFGEKIIKLITAPREVMSEIMGETPNKKTILSDDTKAFSINIVVQKYKDDYLGYGKERLDLLNKSNAFIYSERIFTKENVTKEYVAHLWLHEIVETLALKVNALSGHNYDRDHYFAQKMEIALIAQSLDLPSFDFQFDREGRDWTQNLYNYARIYFENTKHDFALCLDRYISLNPPRAFTQEEAKEVEYSSAYLEVLFKNSEDQYIDVGFYLFKPLYAVEAKKLDDEGQMWDINPIFLEYGMSAYLKKQLPPKQ